MCDQTKKFIDKNRLPLKKKNETKSIFIVQNTLRKIW